MNRYKFRFFSFHSNEIEYPDTEDYGYLLDGADGMIPQQFTGSLDKNNKEIYECDIVLWDVEDPWGYEKGKETKVVGWNQRTMSYRLYNGSDEVNKEGGAHFFKEDVEVIGHIFDYNNPLCLNFLDKSVWNLRPKS